MQNRSDIHHRVLVLVAAITLSCEADTNTNWLTDVKPDNGRYTACALSEKSPFAQYRATQISYTLNSESYSLPVDPAQIENLDRDLRNNPEFEFGEAAQAMLLEYGLVLLPATRPIDRFEDAYATLQAAERPTLITVDSVLHFSHLFFVQVLKNVEVNALSPMLHALLPELGRTLASIYKSQEGELKQAALRDLALMSVALRLLGSEDFKTPPIVAEQVEREVTRIESMGENLEQGRELSAIFNQDCPRDVACSGDDLDQGAYDEGKACYCEDYTVYKPLGHYSETEALTRYFRSSTYLSRMRMRAKSPMETRMAAILTAALNKTTVDYEGERVDAAFLWDRIYRTYAFFTGAADDLTFIEYDQMLLEVLGDGLAISDLSNNERVKELSTALIREREAGATTGFNRASLNDTERTTGLSFLSRSFPFDAYALNRLVYASIGPNLDHSDYNHVLDNLTEACQSEVEQEYGTDNTELCDGVNATDSRAICCSAVELSKTEDRSELETVCRLLPSGLDIAAVFGSDRAQDHLTELTRDYCGYQSALDTVREEVSEFTDADWYRTVYSTWTLALRSVFHKDLTGFPTWMTTDRYQDKNLNTGLASWAQLRHDTFHYIKQSYEPGLITAPPPRDLYWVEPLPEVYAAISDLAKLIRTGLADMALLGDDLAVPIDDFTDQLDAVTAIAINELQAKELSGIEKNTIAFLIQGLIKTIDTLALVDGEKADKPPEDSLLVEKFDVEGEPYKTTIIAEAYHDAHLDDTLYVGSATIDWMAVLMRDDDQSLSAVIGPVFRYHELSRPGRERLDDDEWIEILIGPDAPPRPDFVQSVYAPQ